MTNLENYCKISITTYNIMHIDLSQLLTVKHWLLDGKHFTLLLFPTSLSLYLYEQEDRAADTGWGVKTGFYPWMAFLLG